MRVTLDEVRLIEAILTPSYASSNTEEAMAIATPDRGMLEKVGGLVVEGWKDALKGNFPQYEVVWTDKELMTLRERIDIRARAGSDTEAGMKLKVKIYEEMLGMGRAEGWEWEYGRTMEDYNNYIQASADEDAAKDGAADGTVEEDKPREGVS